MDAMPRAAGLAAEVAHLMPALGVDLSRLAKGSQEARSPLTGEVVARIPEATRSEAEAAIGRAQTAFLAWRQVPAPRRGEFVRRLGDALRAAKPDLGRLVTIETGKILSEGLG